MTEKLGLYKCNICGNIAEILISGNGELVCCGQKMEHLEPKNNDSDTELNEKHAPIINSSEEGTTINVTNHPMINEHYIMFLQAQSEDKNEVHIKYYYPNEEINLNLPQNQNINEAFSYCNIHQLYRSN